MSAISAIRGRLAGRMLIFLGATFLQMVLGIALLPLTTVVLTATDFGYFALLTSVAAFANAIGDGGGSLALPAHYGVSSQDERRRMLATFFLVSFCLSSALALVFVILSPTFATYVAGVDAEQFSWLIVVLTAVSIPLRSMSTIATSVFSVSGRGNAIAGQIAAQAIGTFLGTLIFLFGLHWSTASLFAGALVGQLGALAVSAVALGSQPWATPAARWMRVVRKHAPTAVFAGMTDGARGIGENSLIAAHLSISAVGIYSHARLYYGMLMSATNAVAHNIWSVSLAEAREQNATFAKTEEVWTVVHIFLTLFGVGFSCVGSEFVSLLTHDRLTASAQLVPWFAVLLLIHVSGRAPTAVTYAHGGAASVNRVRASISLVILAALPFVIGGVNGIGLYLGLTGVVAMLVVEAVLFRSYIRWKSATLGRSLPFHDGWAFAGVGIIVFTWLLNTQADFTLFSRCLLFCGITVATAVFERRRISTLLGSFKEIYRTAGP